MHIYNYVYQFRCSNTNLRFNWHWFVHRAAFRISNLHIKPLGTKLSEKTDQKVKTMNNTLKNGDILVAHAEPVYCTSINEGTPTATSISIVKGDNHEHPKTDQEKETITTTHVITEKRIINLGREPTSLTCPYCNNVGLTRTKKIISGTGLISSGVMCFLFWPLFWVPLVCSDVSAWSWCRTP